MHLSVTKSFIVYVNKGAKAGPTPYLALTDPLAQLHDLPLTAGMYCAWPSCSQCHQDLPPLCTYLLPSLLLLQGGFHAKLFFLAFLPTLSFGESFILHRNSPSSQHCSPVHSEPGGQGRTGLQPALSNPSSLLVPCSKPGSLAVTPTQPHQLCVCFPKYFAGAKETSACSILS